MKLIHREHSSYILSKNVRGVSFFYVYLTCPPTIDSEFTDFETALARCKYLSRLSQGWTTPTLARLHGQWVIWSDKHTVFVPLDKATPELLAACPGAVERLKEWNNEPF